MAVHVKSDDGVYRIVIDDEMTIGRAAELLPGLMAPFANGSEVEVNLAAVSEIDTAGLQLLLVLKKEAAAKAIPLRFVAHSKAVVGLLDLCNLAGHFGDPVVLPPSPRTAEG